MEVVISETDAVLVSHSGVALAGALPRRAGWRQRLDAMHVDGLKRPTMPHGEVLLSMIGAARGQRPYVHRRADPQPVDLRRLQPVGQGEESFVACPARKQKRRGVRAKWVGRPGFSMPAKLMLAILTRSAL
jgi:hypothetical protein